MAITTHKTHVGKEDMTLQTNASTAETFTRLTSTGTEIVITKVPDIWDGTGKVNTGKVLVRALDNNSTILHSFGGTS